MKKSFVIPALILISMLAGINSLTAQNTIKTKPNILVVITDDQRFGTIHALGNNEIITPNMDKLASKGVLFTNAHCQVPICGPSRASIMTGLRPSTTGIYGQIDDEKIRGASEPTRSNIFLPCSYFNF